MTLTPLNFGTAPDTDTGDNILQGCVKLEGNETTLYTLVTALAAVGPVTVSGLTEMGLTANSIAENTVEDQEVGTLTNTTVGQTIIVVDDVSGAFKLNAAKTKIVRGKGGLDYETQPAPVVRIFRSVTDALGVTISDYSDITINVTDAADNIYTAPDYFLRPIGHGTQDGLSYANAKAINAANMLAAATAMAAKASGTRDIGIFGEGQVIDWSGAGFDLSDFNPVGSPIRYIGLGTNYQPFRAHFKGTRQEFIQPLVAETTTIFPSDSGNAFVKLATAATATAAARPTSNIQFLWLYFEDLGSPSIFNVAGPCHDIKMLNWGGRNCQRGVDNATAGADCTTMEVGDFFFEGFSKAFGRIRSDSSGWNVHDGYMDSQWQEESPGFAGGWQFDGTAHNNLLEDLVVKNVRETLSGNSYRNGDAGWSERNTYNNIFRRVSGYNNTDSTLDCKGPQTVEYCYGFGCKRTFRFWDNTTSVGCMSENPMSRDLNLYSGGAHQWIGGTASHIIPPGSGHGAFLRIDLYTFLSVDPTTKTFELTDSGGRMAVLATRGTETVAGADAPTTTSRIKSATLRSATIQADTIALTSSAALNAPEKRGYLFTPTFDRAVVIDSVTGTHASKITVVDIQGPLRFAPTTYLGTAGDVYSFTLNVLDASGNAEAIPMTITVTDVSDFSVLKITAIGMTNGSGAFVDTSPFARVLTVGGSVKADNALGTMRVKHTGVSGSAANALQSADADDWQLAGDEITHIRIKKMRPGVLGTDQTVCGQWTTTANMRNFRCFLSYHATTVADRNKYGFQLVENGSSTLKLDLRATTVATTAADHDLEIKCDGVGNWTLLIDGVQEAAAVYTGFGHDSTAAFVTGALSSLNGGVANPFVWESLEISRGAYLP